MLGAKSYGSLLGTIERLGLLLGIVYPFVLVGQTGPLDFWRLDRQQSELIASIDSSMSTRIVRQWRRSFGSPIRFSPLVAYGVIIVGTDAGNIMALRPSDGATKWSFHVNAPVSTSAAMQQFRGVGFPIVFFSAEDGYLYAVNGNTGALLWKLAGGAQTWNSPPNYDVPRTLLYTYAVGVQSRLRAVDVVTGTVLWEAQGSSISPQIPLVVDYKGIVVQGYRQTGTSIVAYRIADGQVLWKLGYSYAGSGAHTSGVVNSFQNGLFVSMARGLIEEYDLDTQNRNWAKTFSPPKEIVGLALKKVSATKAVLVANQSDKLFALDAQTGNVLWTKSHSGNLIDPTTMRTPMPAIHGDLLFNIENGNQLVARRLNDGDEVWNTVLDGSVVSSPALGVNTLVIGTSKGSLYLFSACTCPRPN